MMNNMLGLMDKVKKSVNELAYKKVNEMASVLQNGLLYEFQNDLIFAGHKEDFNPLQGVSVNVEQVSDTEYKLSMDMSKLTDKQKELFEFYFKNAKKRMLGGGA